MQAVNSSSYNAHDRPTASCAQPYIPSRICNVKQQIEVLHNYNDISLNKIKQNQINDANCKQIVDYLTCKILPQSETDQKELLRSYTQYFLSDILYHCEIKSGRGKREDRTFV